MLIPFFFRPQHKFAASTAFLLAFSSGALGQEFRAPQQLVSIKPDGKLSYQPYTAQGDTLLDFSNCGYGGGGVALPTIAAKVTLQPDANNPDDLARIQAAIDQVSALPQGADGFRGAVLLRRGVYRLSDALNITKSGVVLRGEGKDARGTVLFGTARKQYTLIRVGGQAGPTPLPDTRQNITNPYVPVGSRSFQVADGAKFQVGDTVFVTRHGNSAWISEINMERIKLLDPEKPERTKRWTAFSMNLDRVVTNVNGNQITVDAPIPCAIDAQWGGGEITKTSDTERIEKVGIENLFGECDFDRTETSTVRNARADGAPTYLSDEDHARLLVSFTNTKNAWARDLGTRYLENLVLMAGGAKWITVQDCTSVEPISLLTGGRRSPFSIDTGQLILMQRCYASDARHSFVVGARVSGPNVFLDCVGENENGASEPHHRWSVGGMFDNVKGNIAIQDRQNYGSGHGWSGANYVAWNCEGSLALQSPPTAQNFAIGFVGKKSKPPFSGPDGWWESFGQRVQPRSLYLAQLADRLGIEAVQAVVKTP